jgi:hypothetical protein
MQYLNFISVDVLGATRFVVAYEDNADSQKGTAKIGTIDGTNILFGTEKEFTSGEATYNSVAALSESGFVVAYRDTADSFRGNAVIGTILGINITFGSKSRFSDEASYNSIVPLSESGFVIIYNQLKSDERGMARVGTVSGTKITFGNVAEFASSGSADFISAALPNSSGFVVVYTDKADSDHGTAKIGIVSGTTITFGSEYEFVPEPGSTKYNSVAVLSPTKFVVAYEDWGDDRHGTVKIGTVSGTTIAFGSGYEFVSTGPVTWISITTLSEDEFVVVGRDGSDNGHGTAWIGSVSGTTVTFTEEAEYLSASGADYNSIAAFNRSKFVVTYKDGANSNHGTARIGLITTENSGNLFIQGYDIFQASGDLYISGITTTQIITSGNLFIEGQDAIEISGDLFIEGFVESSGISIPSLFIHGYNIIQNSGDIFIHGYNDITIFGNLFIYGQDIVEISGDLFTKGFIEISGVLPLPLFIHGHTDRIISCDLFIPGHEEITTSGDLFLHGVTNHITSGSLFIKGYVDIFASGDLFIKGYDILQSSGDLYIQGYKDFIVSGDLFIQGHLISSFSSTLFTSGSGIIPINNNITLFINGIIAKEPVSCPILDPEAAVQIPTRIITLYQSHIDALINQLGKNTVLNLPPQRALCPNCRQEIWRKRSIGVYKIGGPRPFARGRKCPYCYGKGFLETPVQKCIKCLIKWNPKDFEDYDISVQKRDAIVRLKTYLIYMDDLLRAETAIVEYDQMEVTKLQVRRIRDAIPIGLREDRYCVSFWELI